MSNTPIFKPGHDVMVLDKNTFVLANELEISNYHPNSGFVGGWYKGKVGKILRKGRGVQRKTMPSFDCYIVHIPNVTNKSGIKINEHLLAHFCVQCKKLDCLTLPN